MILFLGGDLRQKYASDYLKSNGIDAYIIQGFELSDEVASRIKSSNVIVLPLPVSKDGETVYKEQIPLKELFEIMPEDALIICGSVGKKVKEIFDFYNLDYIDLLDIETFQIQNALLSAEGAIYYAKENFDSTIHGANIAILGFGRIGKIISYLLYLQGAKITVGARKDTDYVWSRLIGFDGLKIKKTGIRAMNKKYDIIFNTVPSQIMDEEFAKTVGSDTVIIDLASAPFGIDGELVKKYNLNYRRELGIPGRYAPKSAGEIIGKTIINILLSRGIEI